MEGGGVRLNYPKDNDPFAEIDPAKLGEYRAWAHRALDTLIDYRLNWEENGRDKDQPCHSNQANYAESDEAANELYATVLMFANKLIGRKSHAFNAEMFDESAPWEMRAALRKIIQKMYVIWPARPTLVSDFSIRRSIQARDLITALIELDRGRTPDLCIMGVGRDSDLMKERCRFAGVLWSIHLKERGVLNYTAQVVSAFGLGPDGKKTVQRWKTKVENADKYAQKLGYHHVSHVTSLIERAKSVNPICNIDGFGPYIVYNIFGQSKPSLDTLEGIGALYQGLLTKSQ